jgi:hypothetical protein
MTAAEDRGNGYAIAGLILGIAAVFFYTMGLVPILAVVLSSIGLYKVKACYRMGRSPAWIGLLLGLISTVMYMFAYGNIPTPAGEKSWQVPTTINIEQTSTIPRNPALSGPLVRADYEGGLDAVNHLLRNGADPNATGNEQASALMAACINGSLDIVRMQVQHGADVTAKDRAGWMALRYARSCGRRNVEAFLTAHGAIE